VSRRRGALTLALAAAALAAGCGGDEQIDGADGPRAEATATATPPPAPRAEVVRFKAADGASVEGQYTPAGRRAPAIVLLHEIRGGPDQWDGLVPYLHAAGFATLAYRSRASALEQERLPDALAAVRWLRARPDVDRRRLALVGASIGASTAVLAMATGTRRTVDAAVALSPPESADIWALQDDDRYRPHDVLLVSDEREAAAADGMLSGAVRSKAIRAQGTGHGVVLLAEAGVRDALLAWLDAHVEA
jgi:BAAT / Acyl-CoA thioester hydrolase C terminal